VGRHGEAQDDVPEEGEPLIGGASIVDPGSVGEGLPRELVRQLVE
jgi:hypothetical protein